MFLIVYVDDVKMAGPKENFDEAWSLLTSESPTGTPPIKMDPPEPVNRFLGCEHIVFEKEIQWHGGDLTTLEPLAPKKADPNPEETTAKREAAKADWYARPKKTVRVMQYDMREFFKSCVERGVGDLAAM